MWLDSSANSTSAQQVEAGLGARFPNLSLAKSEIPGSCESVTKQCLSLKIWKINPVLAYPLEKIFCKQHSERAISTFLGDEKSLRLAVDTAKAKYAEYLRIFGLRSAELHSSHALASEVEKLQHNHFDDTVCLYSGLKP